MHPIIALWSHPRSMSTALERVMRERGDLDCVHEPFMYYYYVERAVRVMPHFDVDPRQPTRYEDIRDGLLRRAEAGPVFFKDMSYYVLPRFFDDRAFAERLTHAFLIREPRAALLSYHKLDPGLTLEEVGLEAQWRQFAWLAELSGRAPAVVEAEAVRRDPRGVVTAFWRRLGLPFEAAAFSWSAAAQPEGWDQVALWHGTASRSRRIRPLGPAEAAAVRAEFESRAAAAPGLADLLAHHLPFYERLRAHAIEP